MSENKPSAMTDVARLASSLLEAEADPAAPGTVVVRVAQGPVGPEGGWRRISHAAALAAAVRLARAAADADDRADLPALEMASARGGDWVALDFTVSEGMMALVAGEPHRLLISAERAIQVGLKLAKVGAEVVELGPCPLGSHELLAQCFGDRASPDRRCILCGATARPPSLRSVP